VERPARSAKRFRNNTYQTIAGDALELLELILFNEHVREEDGR